MYIFCMNASIFAILYSIYSMRRFGYSIKKVNNHLVPSVVFFRVEI